MKIKIFLAEKVSCKPNWKICDWRTSWRYWINWQKNYSYTYGGKGAHGGGAFSGKDPSKVDRSAAYATRHIAKNLVAAGIADRILVQVSYAIGVAEPMGVFIDTFQSSKVNMSDGEIAAVSYTHLTLPTIYSV